MAEGKILAELDHPNLARVYDLDFHEDRPFLVMEYIRGCNLQQYSQQRKLSPAESAAMVMRVARALARAHARGIVHADIKPKNIVIDEVGEPRVIDFGVGQLHGAWRNETPQEGIGGTPSFMAPEQARGEQVSPRSDVFALGGLLYFLLTGQPAFMDETLEKTLDRARRCNFDRGTLHAAGPAGLERICLKAMEADPRRRYATADELAEALAGFLARPRRLRLALALAAGAVLVLAAVGIWLGTRERGATVPAESPEVRAEKAAQDHLGRPLRHDFPIRIEMLGGEIDRAGQMTLTEGQQVAFRIEPSRNCYLGVWYVDDQGVVTQLFPNKHDPDQLLPAGQARTVPGERAYVIRAKVSRGPEYVHVIASTARWDSLPGQDAGPYRVFQTPEERARWAEKVRGLAVEEDDAPAVSEAVLPFRVQPK